MEFLSDDLQILVLSFLSIKDKINAIETCKRFNRNISKVSILIQKFERFVERNNVINMSEVSNLVLISNDIYVSYYIGRPSRIHQLFCRDNRRNSCIVENCREKRIENIYISLSRESGIYNKKRNVPYCLDCFNRWVL